jgi:hypothetical protein
MSTAHDTEAVSAATAAAIPAPRAAASLETTTGGAGTGPVEPPATPATALCRCGHEKDVHEHYRPGTDCGVCGASCRAFRAARTPATRRRIRRRSRRS